MEKLPTILQYRSYLDTIVSIEKININQAREKYGLYTIKQWRDLIREKDSKTNKEVH